jgi:CubicO group peptidase (beta-lactamase class C family)
MTRNTKSLILQLLILIFLPKTLFGQVNEGLDLTNLSKLNDYIEEQVKAEKLAGAEFLIARNNKIVMHSSRGFSNLETKRKLDKNSIYFIQSMTKPIISVAIMQLYERDLIDFDDEVSKYIPEVASLKVALDWSKGIDSPTEKIKRPITIGQLLSHSSGLSHGLSKNKLDRDIGKLMYGVNYPFFSDYSLHQTVESRANALLSAPLMFQPGTNWYYSAGGDLLAVIIEKVTRQTVSSYLKENIFNPLDMDDTSYNVDREALERVMPVHYTNNKKKIVLSKNQPPRRGTSLYGGTHGLYSTALDYLKFCQMIINGGKLNGERVLKKKTVDLMKINQVGSTYSRENQGFGYGFAIEYDPLLKLEEKAQSLYWGGYFNTRFFIDLKKNIVAIWMTQKLPNSSYEGYHQVLKKNVYNAIIDTE